MMIYSLLPVLLLVVFSGCSSQSIIPDGDDIKVSRKAPKGDCENLGLLTGSSLSAMATREEVLKDLKKTAADKGATHIKVEQFSPTGTSVTGIAYTCN